MPVPFAAFPLTRCDTSCYSMYSALFAHAAHAEMRQSAQNARPHWLKTRRSRGPVSPLALGIQPVITHPDIDDQGHGKHRGLFHFASNDLGHLFELLGGRLEDQLIVYL